MSPLHASGQICEQKRVGARAAALLQDVIVTGNLPLEREAPANPPHCRMKEEQCLEHLLDQVRPIVPSADVIQFMSKHGLGFIRVVFARQKNHGVQEAEQHRRSLLLRQAQQHRPAYVQSLAQASEQRRELRCRREAVPFEPPDLLQPAEEQAHAPRPNENADTHQPEAVPGSRAQGWLGQRRSEVLARHGMVATSDPLAAEAGLEILRQGGNAIDAAVATGAVLDVTSQNDTGIGGDLFALVYVAKDKKLYALNSAGWAPAGWTPDFFTKTLGVERVPT